MLSPARAGAEARRLGLGVPGLTRLLGLTGVRGLPAAGPAVGADPGTGLGLTGVPGLALTGVPGLALTRLLGLALTGAGAGSHRRAGLAALGLRLWPRGPRAVRAATQRCARTLALASRPVLSHDPATLQISSLNAFT